MIEIAFGHFSNESISGCACALAIILSQDVTSTALIGCNTLAKKKKEIKDSKDEVFKYHSVLKSLRAFF